MHAVVLWCGFAVCCGASASLVASAGAAEECRVQAKGVSDLTFWLRDGSEKSSGKVQDRSLSRKVVLYFSCTFGTLILAPEKNLRAPILVPRWGGEDGDEGEGDDDDDDDE